MLCLQPSDWISIANIFVTSIIGIWIGVGVHNTLTTNRAVKDYFISEIKDIRLKYQEFFNKVYANKVSAKFIQNWFKIFTIKINVCTAFLQNEYKVQSDFLSAHNELKRYLTETDEFNDQYKADTIQFTRFTKERLIENHNKLSTDLTRLVIEINKAKRKRIFRS